MSTLTKAECVSRIKEIKTKLNQIHDEQKLLTVDLSTLQQQWQAVLHENMPIKPTERPAYLQSTTGATGPPVATQTNSNSCLGKELNKEEICGSCNTSGHTLENCIKQELDGFVHGCPRCNTREHNFDKCTYSGHKDLYFLVQLRNGLPPIRTEKDYRDLPGFNSIDDRPWTPEFSKKHLNSYRNYEYKSRRSERMDIPDPAWLQEDRIPEGSLSYSAARRDAVYLTQASPISSSSNFSDIVSGLCKLSLKNDYRDSINRANLANQRQIQNGERSGHRKNRLVSYKAVEGLFLKQRNVDMAKKRFWTACFRGVENQ